jgi:hypothetical protein
MKTNLISILGFSTAIVCWENNSKNEAAPLQSQSGYDRLQKMVHHNPGTTKKTILKT